MVAVVVFSPVLLKGRLAIKYCLFQAKDWRVGVDALVTVSIIDPVFCCFSVTEGSGDDQVLPVSGQGWRVGVDAELRHHRPQQPLLATPLHRQRQPRPQVTVCFLLLIFFF